MALESATYIGQLEAANPTTSDPVDEGDNHLRLLKAVLKAQFPSLGNAAVTATAAQINQVNSKLKSFNGRTATAAVPTNGDYDLDMLDDVTILTPLDGHILQHNGTEFVNQYPAIESTSGLWDGYAGIVTDSIYFTNQRRLPDTDLVTIKNSGTGGIGWTLTAVVDVLVTINLMVNVGYTPANLTKAVAVGWTVSGTPAATIPAAGTGRIAYATETITRPDLFDTATGSPVVSSSMVLAAGEVLAVYADGAATVSGATLNLTAMRV
jgi:hypothetical protein